MRLLKPKADLFDRYTVTDRVTAGGQSFGFKGEDRLRKADRPWDREVFVKQYRDLEPTLSEVSRLEVHFETLVGRLDSKSNYMVLPIQVGLSNDSVVAVYPWVTGNTLEAELRAGMDHPKRVRTAIALSKLLVMLHSKEIAHLDMKPQNVVLSPGKDGQLYVRLVDFDAASIDGVCLRKSHLGTPGYMSPEHLDLKRYGKPSAASDIFTLGIMLSEILLDFYPVRSATRGDSPPIEVLPFPSELEIHRDVVGMIGRCLSHQPHRRPKAGHVLKVLNQHFNSELRAVSWHDRWSLVEGLSLVRLSGTDEPSEFERVYYRSIEITRSEMRGAKQEYPSGNLFRLDIGAEGCYITNLGVVVLTLSGSVLVPGVKVKILGRKKFEVGNLPLYIEVCQR